MARSKSQSAAFDIMAGLDMVGLDSQTVTDVAEATPIAKAPLAVKNVESAPESAPKAIVKKTSQVARSRQDERQSGKSRTKTRRGAIPSERPLQSCNTMLYVDQLKPLKFLEIETGENRSELIRRLLDEELERKGFGK